MALCSTREGPSCWGHAGTLEHTELRLQKLLESLWALKLHGWVFSCGGSGFAPFPKLLTGSWHRTTQSLLMQNTSQLSCKVVPWWGKEHKFYLCSSDRLLPQQNSSFITSFPRCSSLYASERKHANGLIVFKEEKIYFRREFLQAVQPLLSLQNHSVHGMD